MSGESVSVKVGSGFVNIWGVCYFRNILLSINVCGFLFSLGARMSGNEMQKYLVLRFA